MRNDDAFVFDSQIIAQAVAFKQRIVEVPINTKYFAEASSTTMRANLRYGVATLGVMGRLVLHRAHLSRSRLFET